MGCLSSAHLGYMTKWNTCVFIIFLVCFVTVVCVSDVLLRVAFANQPLGPDVNIIRLFGFNFSKVHSEA